MGALLVKAKDSAGEEDDDLQAHEPSGLGREIPMPPQQHNNPPPPLKKKTGSSAMEWEYWVLLGFNEGTGTVLDPSRFPG